MKTLITMLVATGSRSYWCAAPGAEIIVLGKGIVTEFRNTVDWIKGETGQSVHVCSIVRKDDGDIEIVAAPRVRWGYRFFDKDGVESIVGDADLFIEDMTEKYDNERVRELARRVGMI